MKTRVFFILVGLFTLAAYGVGTVRESESPPSSSPLERFEFAWTSDSNGDVNDTAFGHQGYLERVTFVPSSTAQPSDLYDLSLLDSDGVDILDGAGSNLSNSVSSSFVSDPPMPVLGAIYPTISNAGDTKSGTLVLCIRRSR